MTPSPQVPDRAPPAAVATALRRVCDSLERDAGGWRIGSAPVSPGAAALAEGLYGHWYTQPAVAPAADSGDPPLGRPSLLSALRAAHAGATSTSAGWIVVEAGAQGAVSVSRDGAARVLWPGDYRMPLRPGVPAAPGEPAEALDRIDHFDAERGIWWAYTEPPPQAPKGRIYLNLRPASAPRAVHEVTAALAPFAHQLKCPVLAEACNRVDALVVYHRRADREQAIAALLERWAQLGRLLDPAVPPLTCEVRPGLAWADEVDEEHSYGETRCRALATAIDGAAAAWSTSGPDARLEVLLGGLRDAGIDPHRPWQVAG